jgi:CheY-like chemotaxis protein
MLTTGPGPHRVTRRWTSGRGSGRSRSDDLRGAERIRALRETAGRSIPMAGWVRAFPNTQERGQMNATRVLCVENRPEYMDALKYMLEAAGYEVMAATTGSQGLRLLTDLHIDGVLLEYDLPDATGSAVRAEMKRIKPDIPVLLFAGIGSQTPFLLRFFDSYLRNSERPEVVFDDLDT